MIFSDIVLNVLSTVGLMYSIVSLICVFRGAKGLVYESIEVLCGVAIGRLGYDPSIKKYTWTREDLYHLEAGLRILQSMKEEEEEEEEEE